MALRYQKGDTYHNGMTSRESPAHGAVAQLAEHRSCTPQMRVRIPSAPLCKELSIMSSFLVPASKNRISIVNIMVPPTHGITVSKMEEIRLWIDTHRHIFPKCTQEVKDACGYDVEIHIYPEITNDIEYVFLCELNNRFSLSQIEKDGMTELIEQSYEDKDLIIFISSDWSIRRINKSLLPFL